MKYVEQATDFVDTYPEFKAIIGMKPQRPEVEYA